MPASPRVSTAATSGTGDFPHRWLAGCVLALIVACEYVFRLRDPASAVAGNPDLFVLLEIATFAVVAGLLFVRFRPAPALGSAHWVTIAAYAYTAVLALSAVYSPYLEMAMVRAWQMVIILALTRSMALHGTRQTMHTAVHWFAALISGSVVFGAIVPIARPEHERFSWLYIHPVEAGQMLAIAVVVLVAYATKSLVPRVGPRWPRAVYLGLLAICVAGLVGTNTRGAVLGAATGTVAVLWIRFLGLRKLETVVAGVVGVLAFALTASPAIKAFFVRGGSLEQLATLNSRTELWGYAFQAFAERPLYGYGLSASRGLFLDEIGLGGAHNAVVNLLVNSGVIGLFGWIALVAGIFVNAARVRGADVVQAVDYRLDRGIILGVMVMLLSDSVFTEALGAPANAAAIWLLMLAAWSGMLRYGEQPTTTVFRHHTTRGLS